MIVDAPSKRLDKNAAGLHRARIEKPDHALAIDVTNKESVRILFGTTFAFSFCREFEKQKSGSEETFQSERREPNPTVKEFAMFAMKKLLIAGVAGLMVMAVAGTQTAMAAPFRGVYHERCVPRPVYRTAYGHQHFTRGPVFRPYCW
jgi:hypothetical protein